MGSIIIEVKWAQFSNNSPSRFVTEDGILISSKKKFELKQLNPISFIVSGKIIFLKEHPANVELSNFVILDGIITSCKLLHSKNADLPSFVTEVGIIIFVKHWYVLKQFCDISLIVSGIENSDTTFKQPESFAVLKSNNFIDFAFGEIIFDFL